MTFVTWLLNDTFIGPVALIAGGALLAWVSARSFYHATRPRRRRKTGVWSPSDGELLQLLSDYYAQPVTDDEANSDHRKRGAR